MATTAPLHLKRPALAFLLLLSIVAAERPSDLSCSALDVLATTARVGRRVQRSFENIQHELIQMGESIIQLDDSREPTPGTCCCGEDHTMLWETWFVSSPHTRVY